MHAAGLQAGEAIVKQERSLVTNVLQFRSTAERIEAMPSLLEGDFGVDAAPECRYVAPETDQA